MLRLFQILIALLLMFNTSYAQVDCNNYLEQAKLMLKIGQFKKAILILNNCSAADTSLKNKWQTSRLLASCYIELDSSEKAELEVKKLLSNNPLYKTSILEDSKKLRNLINSVHRIPRYTLSIYASGNRSIPDIRKRFEIINKETPKNYGNTFFSKDQDPGLGLGLSGSYGINEKFSFHFGATFIENNYTFDYQLVNYISKTSEFESNSETVDVTYYEKLKYVQAPLFARYHIVSNRKVNVFCQAGYWLGVLTKSNYYLQIKNKNSDEYTPLSNIENVKYRKRFNQGLLLGLGLGFKVFEGQLFTDINFQKSFHTINKENERLSNKNLISDYFLIDDNLRLNSLIFSVGYTFYFNYFVQKVEKKR